ncbi:hypothetical protein MOQ_000321 [Trypanosoma cruzi marinkellei]|uniref:DNA mismatch repair protein MSH2 n=1 Tax=Trypanosoma cruzi marinkellei TaxID=85056 RepID=K2NNQ1_TRYCR|nr:hypothetical protein MOQ_000321 [Trypanosoma cruzi marinkellei]
MLPGTVLPVEHVRIGKHVFPLYSHPILRKKLEDEALLEREIERRLQDPQLQLAVSDVVERLLREGVKDEISEEMAEKYLDEALGRLDDYFDDMTSVGASSAHLSAKLTTNDRRRSFLPTVRPPPPTVRRVLSLKRHNGAPTASHGMSTQQRGLHAAREHKHHVTPQRDVNKEVDDDTGSFALVGLSRRHLFSSCFGGVEEEEEKEEGEVSPKNSVERNFSPKSTYRQSEDSEQRRLKMLSSSHSRRGASSEWRNAVRMLFYSMLSLRLEESGGVRLEEMDLRGGSQRLLRLQGSVLSTLNQKAFGALDVTLDGNSSAIHRRQPAVTSILQWSHAQRAERPIEFGKTALRQKVLNMLARPHQISSMSKKVVRATGTSLNSTWEKMEPSATLGIATGGTQLELPSETGRSRVMAHIIERIKAGHTEMKSNENVRK